MAKKKNLFERFANWATIATGSSAAFMTAITIIIIWGVTGPVFKYSDTWQLIINTGTTIVTFLMVFLIQKSQNKEAIAVQLKLNELIAASNHASNRLLNIQDLSEEELKTLYEHYRKLVELTQTAESSTQSHTVEDAIDSTLDDMKDDLMKQAGK